MGMMTMLMLLKAAGLISFIFTVLLLALSFFVLFVVRKTEAGGLKTFGYIIAILLWICAAIVFSAVISVTSARCNLNIPMMGRMRGQKQAIMQGKTPGMMQGSQMKGQEMMKEKIEEPKKSQ